MTERDEPHRPDQPLSFLIERRLRGLPGIVYFGSHNIPKDAFAVSLPEDMHPADRITSHIVAPIDPTNDPTKLKEVVERTVLLSLSDIPPKKINYPHAVSEEALALGHIIFAESNSPVTDVVTICPDNVWAFYLIQLMEFLAKPSENQLQTVDEELVKWIQNHVPLEKTKEEGVREHLRRIYTQK